MPAEVPFNDMVMENASSFISNIKGHQAGKRPECAEIKLYQPGAVTCKHKILHTMAG